MSPHALLSATQQRAALLSAARLLADRVRATEVHVCVPCGYEDLAAIAVWRWPGVVNVRLRYGGTAPLVQCLPGRPDMMDPAAVVAAHPMKPAERLQALRVAAGRLAEREKLPQVYLTVEVQGGNQLRRSVPSVAVFRWPGTVLVRSRDDGQLLAMSKPGEPFTPDDLGVGE